MRATFFIKVSSLFPFPTMTGPLINHRAMPIGGGVPLKGKLGHFFSKYSQEKCTKQILESRSPSSGSCSAETILCGRQQPEGAILLTPTARRLSVSSPPLTTFDRRHGINLSRMSSTMKQTQIRSPHQSKRALKKLSPSLSGNGTTVHSPWVTPCSVQVSPFAAAENGGYRMDAIIKTVSSQEQDLPCVISPAYKFVPIEIEERLEKEQANEIYFSSSDYDICSDAYMMSQPEGSSKQKDYSEAKGQSMAGGEEEPFICLPEISEAIRYMISFKFPSSRKYETTYRFNTQKKKRKKRKSQAQDLDKYSFHSQH